MRACEFPQANVAPAPAQVPVSGGGGDIGGFGVVVRAFEVGLPEPAAPIDAENGCWL